MLSVFDSLFAVISGVLPPLNELDFLGGGLATRFITENARGSGVSDFFSSSGVYPVLLRSGVCFLSSRNRLNVKKDMSALVGSLVAAVA